MSALFHHENLLARSYSSLEFHPKRVRSMLTPAFQPLWEDSDTFSDEQLKEHKERAQRLNQQLTKLTKVSGNGGTKSSFKVRKMLCCQNWHDAELSSGLT